MKKNTSKIFATILLMCAIAIVAACIRPVIPTIYNYSGFTISVIDDQATIVGVDCNYFESHIVVSSTINDISVVRIAGTAFRCNTSIQSSNNSI